MTFTIDAAGKVGGITMDLAGDSVMFHHAGQ